MRNKFKRGYNAYVLVSTCMDVCALTDLGSRTRIQYSRLGSASPPFALSFTPLGTISDHNIVPDHSFVLFNLPAHFPSNYHKILYTSFSGVC